MESTDTQLSYKTEFEISTNCETNTEDLQVKVNRKVEKKDLEIWFARDMDFATPVKDIRSWNQTEEVRATTKIRKQRENK